MADMKAVVYGLSTEGYEIASKLAKNNVKVAIIDESQGSAIILRPEIAKAYPNVNALIEDEPLLGLEPLDLAVHGANYFFFTPRIRKTGLEVKGDISEKFKNAIKALNKDSSIIYNLPTGIGGNNENIILIEHVTGMKVGSDLNYYYMPVGPEKFENQPIGSFKSKTDNNIIKFLQDPEVKPRFKDLESAEFMHAIRVLSHYSYIASIFEMCKHIKDSAVREQLDQEEFRELYIDDITNGLFDLRAISSSLEGTGPLIYLVNGSIKVMENYIKYLIDQIREILKKKGLKASRTKIAIAWTIDANEMRGDKLDLLTVLELKLKDYISDVERHQGETFGVYHTDKTTITVACSKYDYETITKNDSKYDMILMKANPLCEVVYQR
ncbi:MAG: hypothetical protein CMO16_04015 [Thaumarchaeota archaeon]|nr:hypothetical protein [Nitrososphaerota archaeon]